MDFIMEMKMSKLMDTLMGNKFGKTIWLQRMIKMMDKIDNFRSKHWKTIGYKMIFITKNEFNIIWVDKNNQ